MIPWWIVTTLRDGADGFSHERLTRLLDSQLRQWSLSSQVMKEADAPRWWQMEMLPRHAAASADDLITHLDKFLYNPLQIQPGENSPRLGGRIVANELRVALVGDARSEWTRAYLHCLGRLLRLRAGQLFGAVTVKPIAFIFLPQDANQLNERAEIAQFLCELKTMMHLRQASERPFDTIILLQDTNTPVNNPRGYSDLSEPQIADLFAQVLFHLMTSGDDALTKNQRFHDADYLALGSAAIYYDWRGHQQQLSRIAGRELLDKFKTAERPPFLSESEAKAALSGVTEFLDANKLFEEFTRASERPSFAFDARIWQQARDRQGRRISPWYHAFSTALYDIYFREHLRYLPLRLSEHARLFLLSRQREFGEHLQERRRALWDGAGSDPRLKGRIDEAVRSVLSGERGQARSLQQARRVLHKIHAAADLSSLSGIEDELQRLKVFAVPEQLRNSYEQAVPPLDTDTEPPLYQSIVESIKQHPSPAALALRAFLVGVMLGLLGERLLDYLSPRVTSFDWPLQIPGLTALLLLALTMLFALGWRYWVETLRKLQKGIRSYIGAVLRHAQTAAREQVRVEMRLLGEQAQEYCNRLLAKIDELRDALAYPESESRGYQSTVFNRSLLADVDVPGRHDPVKILTRADPAYQISVDGREVFFHDCLDDQKHSLVRRMLEQQVEGDRRPCWQLFADSILGETDAATLDRAAQTVRRFAENLYPSAPQMRLVGWLLQESEAHRGRIIERLRCLAAPPVSFHPGAEVKSNSREWLYSNSEQLERLLGFTEDEQKVARDNGGALSLAAYQPFAELRGLSTLHAMCDDTEVRAAEKDSRAPARIFTLATARLPDAPDLTLLSALDGTRLTVNAAQTEIRALRERLGLSIADEARRQL